MAQVFIPPLLVEQRSDQEWYEWVTEQMKGVPDHKTGKPFTMPGIQSKSGKEIVNHAVEWAQYQAMQQAVGGELATVGGLEVYELVLNGTYISLMPLFSTEIYSTFVPVWRSLNNDQYEVGYEAPTEQYTAPSAKEAYVMAQAWYARVRQEEIDALVDMAKREITSRVGPFRQDVITARLLESGVIYGRSTSVGDTTQYPVVWEHGEFKHGNSFVVDGGNYRYGVGVTAPVAAILAFVAVNNRGLTLSPPDGDDLKRLALDGWQKGRANLYQWSAGYLNNDGHIVHNNTVIGLLKWNGRRFAVKDGMKKTIIDVATKEQPAEILVAWACSKLAGKQQAGRAESA